MTNPDPVSDVAFEYPKTWPAVVGFSLWRFGVISILVGMICVQYYYAQQQNNRGEELADKMMACITQSTATQQTTAIILENLNRDLNKHQSWEEKQLDLMLPIINRIDQTYRRP